MGKVSGLVCFSAHNAALNGVCKTAKTQAVVNHRSEQIFPAVLCTELFSFKRIVNILLGRRELGKACNKLASVFASRNKDTLTINEHALYNKVSSFLLTFFWDLLHIAKRRQAHFKLNTLAGKA